MKICATRHPVQRHHEGGIRVPCWSADFAEGLGDDVPEELRAPLEREEIAVADEA
jgi:hypothetical protein